MTEPGRDLLRAAVPVWRATHDAIDEVLDAAEGKGLRADRALTGSEDRPER